MDDQAPKRRASTNLVCVENTQLPREKALEARGLAKVAARPHSARDGRSGTHMTSRSEQLKSNQLRCHGQPKQLSGKPGSKVRHVDALSRHVQAVTTDHTPSKEVGKAEQQKERFCSTLRVRKAKSPTAFFYDEDGVIYGRRRGREHQLVVPVSMARVEISQNHDPTLASHPGWQQTFETVCIRYWWTRMRKDVGRYVSQCNECRRRKQAYGHKANRRYYDRRVKEWESSLETL
jgi:hypothetical protein